MGKVKSEGSAPKRGGKGRPGARVVIFSAAAALGVVAVRRSRASRDDAPTSASVPPAAPVGSTVGSTVASTVASTSTVAATPPPPAASPAVSAVSVLRKAEPVIQSVPEPQVQAFADDEDDEEPPIWAAFSEPAEPAPLAEQPLQSAPTSVFEAAFTGAPAEFVQPFAPLATPTAPGANQTAPESNLTALSGEPWAGQPMDGTPIGSPASPPPPAPPGAGKGVLLATPKRRKIAALIVVAALVLITIIVLIV